MSKAAIAPLLLGLVSPALASASGADAAEQSEVALDTIVVVASRVAEPLAQVVASVAVIEREEIERRLDQDIGDLVRYLPGVRVDSDPNRFGRQGFAIRGLGGNRVRVEIDGVPLPDAFAVGQFASAGRDLVDLEAVQRVEILRGPASTLYGSDALAGIVAFRSRDPADLLARSPDAQAWGLRLAYAGRDLSRLAGASWAGESEGGWQAMLLAARREGSETRNRAWREIDAPNPAEYARDALLGKLVRDAGGFGRWSVVLDASRSQQDTAVRSQHFAPGRFATTYRLDAEDAARRTRLSAQGEWEQPLAWLDRLELLVYGQDSRVRQDSFQYRLPDRATPFESLRERRFAFEQAERGLDLVGVAQGDWLGAAHRHVFGIEIEHTRYEGLRDGVEVNLASGASSNVILGERFPVRDFPHSSARRIAAFWQDEIGVGRFALLPGLRWERYRLDASPDAIFREDYPDIATVDIGETSLTPKLGLRWSVSERASLFLQHARGFRAPPFSDVNIGLFLPSFNYEVRPNPDLRAETSRGLEAGLRWQGQALQGTLSAFDNRYRDLIESRANLGVDPDSGALVFQSVNRDRARIRGIEAEFALELGALREGLDGWSLRGAASAVRGEDTARDRPLNSIDPESATLGLRYESLQGDYGGELVAQGVRGKRRIDASAGALFAPPGYASFDLLVWLEPRRGMRVNLGLFNLLDRRSWDWGSVRGLAADAPNAGFYTRPGRSLAASLQLDW
jgi:hemoglobin/transferrin/lactoferrin receptor protein